jgi:SCY1-like protein 2
MTEKLIPLLRNIKTKEPSVALAALSVYAEMGKNLGHDIIASDILPGLWPMAVGVLLNMEQVCVLFQRRLTPVQSIVGCHSRTGE